MKWIRKKGKGKKSQTRKPELLFYDSFCFLKEKKEFFMKMIEDVKQNEQSDFLVMGIEIRMNRIESI